MVAILLRILSVQRIIQGLESCVAAVCGWETVRRALRFVGLVRHLQIPMTDTAEVLAAVYAVRL
jgi:hypothetical protein